MTRNSISASENTKVKIPLEKCFVLKRPHQNFYIKDAVFPPRLCEFTDDIDEAQTFESLREVSNAAAYIKQHAWNIIVTNMKGEPVFEPALVMPTPPYGHILKEGEKP